MFFTVEEISLYAKRARLTSRKVSEELRGWSWPEPPVLPPSSSALPVSDLSGSICKSGRIIYLTYVKWMKVEPSVEALRGGLIHGAYVDAAETTRRLIYSGEALDGSTLRFLMADQYYEALKRLREYSSVPNFETLVKWIWDRATSTFSASLDKARDRSHSTKETLASIAVPFLVEYPLDGSLVGVSPNARADAFLPQIPMIVELKTGRRRRSHELSVAAYALAYESQYETPMDLGLLCYVRTEDGITYRCELLVVDDSLRSEFLEERDLRLKVLEEGVDPGLPKYCDQECPFLQYCGGKVRS